MTQSNDDSDDRFREWMRGNLARAADRFGLAITGNAVFGWRLRSISAAADSKNGPRWLRVGSELAASIEDSEVGDFWYGLPESNVIIGVPKPEILDSAEWDEPDRGRRVRADVMTRMPGRPCSPTDALRAQLYLPGRWWAELRRSVEAIRATPTTRYASRVGQPSQRIRRIFGDRVAELTRGAERETTHGDLHWANVFGPDLVLVDWELWGPGLVGSDAATLFLFSLLVPRVAARVHDAFGDVLDSPAGRLAQLGVASRILWRAEQGDNADLADAVRRHVAPLVDVLT